MPKLFYVWNRTSYYRIPHICFRTFQHTTTPLLGFHLQYLCCQLEYLKQLRNALEFQYRIQSKIGIVKDAVDAAVTELKRKDPDVGSCSVLCVKHKVGVKYETKKVKLEHPMKAEYVSQASESQLLHNQKVIEKERLWLSLEPAVIQFCISGL